MALYNKLRRLQTGSMEVAKKKKINEAIIKKTNSRISAKRIKKQENTGEKNVCVLVSSF